eukprot:4800388-Pyramimonas_sp.AAC.1
MPWYGRDEMHAIALSSTALPWGTSYRSARASATPAGYMAFSWIKSLRNYRRKPPAVPAVAATLGSSASALPRPFATMVSQLRLRGAARRGSSRTEI